MSIFELLVQRTSNFITCFYLNFENFPFFHERGGNPYGPYISILILCAIIEFNIFMTVIKPKIVIFNPIFHRVPEVQIQKFYVQTTQENELYKNMQ